MNSIDRRPRLSRALRRLLLAALAIGGTAAYALSFHLTAAAETLVPLGAVVGVAAGAAWLVFGAILLAATRGRAGVMGCVDLCLEVMSLGMIALLTGAFANATVFAVGHVATVRLGADVALYLHGLLLVIADVLMGAAFVSAAPRLGLSNRRALLLWVFGLNGAFAAILAVLVAGRFLT